MPSLELRHVPKRLLADIDEWAQSRHLSRAEPAIELLRIGYEATSPKALKHVEGSARTWSLVSPLVLHSPGPERSRKDCYHDHDDRARRRVARIHGARLQRIDAFSRPQTFKLTHYPRGTGYRLSAPKCICIRQDERPSFAQDAFKRPLVPGWNSLSCLSPVLPLRDL